MKGSQLFENLKSKGVENVSVQLSLSRILGPYMNGDVPDDVVRAIEAGVGVTLDKSSESAAPQLSDGGKDQASSLSGQSEEDPLPPIPPLPAIPNL